MFLLTLASLVEVAGAKALIVIPINKSAVNRDYHSGGSWSVTARSVLH